MSKITRAVFRPGSTTTQISGLSMYDYGQELEIHGLSLPREVAVEYSLNGAEPTIDRIGYTIDGVTTAAIPDGILSEQGNLKIYIRVLSPDSGQTEYTITGKVNYREKPSVQPEPGEVNPFGEAIQLTSEAADRAEDSEKSAESWAHGHEEYPERDEDNAAYYAKQAKDALKEISGQVEDAKKDIDRYASEKESQLKGDTGNVYFAAFKVVNGRLKMYSDPEIDKVRFVRVGSRLMYRLNF